MAKQSAHQGARSSSFMRQLTRAAVALLFISPCVAPSVGEAEPAGLCDARRVIRRGPFSCWLNWCFDLAGCTNVSIDLEPLGDRGAQALALALREEEARERIASIRLRGAGIGDEGAAALIAAAIDLPQLQMLECSRRQTR